MRQPTLTIGHGPNEGAHRLTVHVDEPTALWGEIAVPLLSHMPLVLGQPVRAWNLDRRPLLTASYSQSVGGNWPFAIDGPTVARRLRLRAPALTGAELAGLVDLLRPAVRRSCWEEIVLPSPGLRASAVLEVVHGWAQLFWVELEWIHWTS